MANLPLTRQELTFIIIDIRPMLWLTRFFILLLLIGAFSFGPVLLKNRWVQSAIFLLMGVGLVWMTADMTHKNRLLLKSAETIPATITYKNITRKRRGHNYNIYLEYRLPSDGTIQTGHKKIGKSAYQQTTIGDTLNLMVATEDSSITLLEQSYPPSPYPSFLMIVMIVFFFGVGILNLYLK